MKKHKEKQIVKHGQKVFLHSNPWYAKFINFWYLLWSLMRKLRKKVSGRHLGHSRPIKQATSIFFYQSPTLIRCLYQVMSPSLQQWWLQIQRSVQDSGRSDKVCSHAEHETIGWNKHASVTSSYYALAVVRNMKTSFFTSPYPSFPAYLIAVLASWVEFVYA